MDCNYTTIKTCELHGSTFRSRVLDFGNFDISDYDFEVKFFNPFGQPQGSQALTKLANVVEVPLTLIENKSGRIRAEVWMEREGGFKDIVVVFDVGISTTGCPTDSSVTGSVSVTFGGMTVPINITQAIVNNYLDYDNLTPEQKAELRFDWEDFTPENILELQAPAIEAAEIAEIATENANTATLAAQNATTEAITATNNAETATSEADAATIAANNAADTANLATSEANTATVDANDAADLANQKAGEANTAAGSANAAAGAANTAAANAQSAAILANAAAENADDKATLAQTAATNADTKAAAADTATDEANTATSAANAAASAANAAATTANAARGWSPMLVADTTTIPEKTLVKLSAWIGGTGTAPTTNVGQWQTAAGGYTATAASALDLNQIVTTNVSDRVTALESIVQNNTWYGIEWDATVSNPIITRIGNTALHQSLPIQVKMRRCLLKDDGSVNYYLDANDSTKKADGTAANLTGTDGQVMVEIPKHYRRFDIEGNKCRCLISENQLPDFHEVPKVYVSAYEATVDRTSTLKLASVVNTTANFRGGNNNAAWDAQSKTLLGRPATLISLTNFRTYARNRGNGTKWNILTNNANKSVFWLYMVEYANRNSQSAFNATLDGNGYKQGGLGAGVTNLIGAKWDAFNTYMPFIPMGHTNSLGNNTGVVAYVMPTEYDAVPLTTFVSSYRGIENIFGHIWKSIDGAKIRVQSAAAGGRSILYTCDNPASFQDTDYAGYKEIGDVTRADAYIKSFILGEFGDILPAETGASSTTYWCDYGYNASIPGSGEAQKVIFWGGAANDAATAGIGMSYSYETAAYAFTYFGTRLTFTP